MSLMYNDVQIIGVRFVDNTGAPLTDGSVQGNVASGATDSGNPVKVGGRYNSSPPTFTNGQRGDLQLTAGGSLKAILCDTSGNNLAASAPGDAFGGFQAQLTTSYGLVFNGTSWYQQRGDANGMAVQSGLSSTFWNYAAAASGIVSSTADVAIKAAAGASVRNYLKTLTIGHDTLSAVTEIVVKDGSTVLWRGKLQTGAVDTASASVIQFDPPLKGTANTALNVALLSSVTGGVYVNATGFTGS